MIPKWDGYVLAFLPSLPSHLADVVRSRRKTNVGPEGDLLALEAAGASHEELAHAVEGYYYARHATFRGLGSGFTPRSSFPSDSPKMGIWALERLESPWPVLQHLGTNRDEVIRYLLGNTGPNEWLRLWAELGIPDQFRSLVGGDGFRWQGPAPFPPVPWIPNPMGGGLDLSDLHGPAPIPDAFVWRGTFSLQSCGGLGTLKVAGGNRLVVHDCPGLLEVTVTNAIDQVEISDCPDLLEVILPEGRLEVRRCPSLKDLNLARVAWRADGIFTRYAWANEHRPTGSLYLEDCPGITEIKAPSGSLRVHRCDALEAIHRSGDGDLCVDDCGRVREIRMGPGSASVSHCPDLALLHRDGTGDLQVEDCAGLIRIRSHFSKDTTNRDSITIRDCPELAELQSLAQKLRHCGAVTLVNCPKLWPPLPWLRTTGQLTLEDCPGVAESGVERRGSGWLMGAPRLDGPHE